MAITQAGFQIGSAVQHIGHDDRIPTHKEENRIAVNLHPTQLCRETNERLDNSIYYDIYYFNRRCFTVETAKIFENGKSQAVRLPKKFRFAGDEVYVQKLGEAVILMSKESAWDIFMDGVRSFTDDFFADGREGEVRTVRDAL